MSFHKKKPLFFPLLSSSQSRWSCHVGLTSLVPGVQSADYLSCKPSHRVQQPHRKLVCPSVCHGERHRIFLSRRSAASPLHVDTSSCLYLFNNIQLTGEVFSILDTSDYICRAMLFHADTQLMVSGSRMSQTFGPTEINNKLIDDVSFPWRRDVSRNG
jgi:hypothetical protein